MSSRANPYDNFPCACPDRSEPFAGPHIAPYAPSAYERAFLGGAALPYGLAVAATADFWPEGVPPAVLWDIASPQIGAIRPRMVQQGNTK